MNKLRVGEDVSLLCWIDHEIVATQAWYHSRLGDDANQFTIYFVHDPSLGERLSVSLHRVTYADRAEGITWSRGILTATVEDSLRAAYMLVQSSLTESDFPRGPTGREGPRVSSLWLPR